LAERQRTRMAVLRLNPLGSDLQRLTAALEEVRDGIALALAKKSLMTSDGE
jgi:hypothetical protein